MRRPGFLGGVVVAVVLALGAAAVWTALSPLFGARNALRAVMLFAGLAYIGYLLSLGRWRPGALTALALWAVASLAAVWLLPSTAALFLVLAGLIWLTRSLFFHDGVLAAAADFLITAFAVVLTVAAVERTGSVAMATWSFFLVQAAFCVIPTALPARTQTGAGDEFNRAARRALAAARALRVRDGRY
ncbi:MAG: hypothetical protein R3315_13465 [Woeseiaceae bacterium]|nr:hypothetical protein [Woeseiaceae bacterium]